MKIALLWPDYWPYIRRGTERMTHDIAQYLQRRGHEVHILTTKPGRAAERDEGGVRVILSAQCNPSILIKARWVPHFDTHPLQALPILLREKYDLIHAFFYTYAPVLAAAKLLTGTPYIFHVVSIPPAWARPGDSALLKLALRGAAEVRVFSQWCASYMRKNYGVECTELAPTVDQTTFRPTRPRDQAHRQILFTGDLAEERKGAHLLTAAFNRVHRQAPDTQLVLAGPGGSHVPGSKAIVSTASAAQVGGKVLGRLDDAAKDAVVFQGVGTLGSLPDTYSTASLTVLPATGEPFGMVLTESLSCGTPAVGARSGAIPEILTDTGVGRLFDLAGSEELTVRNLGDAILEALALSAEDSVIERSRTHAQRWTWDKLGPLLEAMQERAVGAHAAG